MTEVKLKGKLKYTIQKFNERHVHSVNVNITLITRTYTTTKENLYRLQTWFLRKGKFQHNNESKNDANYYYCVM